MANRKQLGELLIKLEDFGKSLGPAERTILDTIVGRAAADPLSEAELESVLGGMEPVGWAQGGCFSPGRVANPPPPPPKP